MKKSPLLVIFLIIFFDLMCFGIVIPILPYYSKDFGASAFELGLLMASFSVAQFLFSPLWGTLSDRFGRRPILLSTIFGGSLAMLAMGFATSLPLLFLGRILAGIFGANISTASAYIADVTDEKNRAKGMGIIGAGFGLGFIFGPAIGGLLSPHGYRVPILAASALSLFNLFFAYIVLCEPKLSQKARNANRRKLSWNLAREAFQNPLTAVPLTLFFFCTLAFTQLEVAFGLFVLDRFHYDARHAGALLAVMGVVMVAVQGGAIGRLSKKFGERKLVLIGIASMTVALLGAAVSFSAVIFACFLAWIAFGNGLVNPSLSSLVSKGAPENIRGGMMGIYQSMGSLARIIGPPISGFLFDHFGSASPIYAASVVMALTVIYASKIKYVS